MTISARTQRIQISGSSESLLLFFFPLLGLLSDSPTLQGGESSPRASMQGDGVDFSFFPYGGMRREWVEVEVLKVKVEQMVIFLSFLLTRGSVYFLCSEERIIGWVGWDSEALALLWWRSSPLFSPSPPALGGVKDGGIGIAKMVAWYQGSLIKLLFRADKLPCDFHLPLVPLCLLSLLCGIWQHPHTLSGGVSLFFCFFSGVFFLGFGAFWFFFFSPRLMGFSPRRAAVGESV